MCVCVCVCVCIHIYIHTYIHTYIHIHIDPCIYRYQRVGVVKEIKEVDECHEGVVTLHAFDLDLRPFKLLQGTRDLALEHVGAVQELRGDAFAQRAQQPLGLAHALVHRQRTGSQRQQQDLLQDTKLKRQLDRIVLRLLVHLVAQVTHG